MGLGGKTLDKLETYGKGLLVVAGSFAPNSTSDPAAASNKGSLVSTVTRAAAGRWTVTLKIPVKSVIAMVPGRREVANNVKSDVEFGTVSNEGTNTALSFIIRNLVDGTETDPAGSPDANIRISFILVCQIGAVK